MWQAISGVLPPALVYNENAYMHEQHENICISQGPLE